MSLVVHIKLNLQIDFVYMYRKAIKCVCFNVSYNFYENSGPLSFSIPDIPLQKLNCMLILIDIYVLNNSCWQMGKT